jgi:hypothetical protein
VAGLAVTSDPKNITVKASPISWKVIIGFLRRALLLTVIGRANFGSGSKLDKVLLAGPLRGPPMVQLFVKA